MTDKTALAHDWIATDAAAVRDEIRRLGIDEAAEHNAGLAEDAVSSGDTRWEGVTTDALREAMRSLGTPVRVTPQPEGAGCDLTQDYLRVAGVEHERDASGVCWVTGDLDDARRAVGEVGHGDPEIDAEMDEPTLESLHVSIDGCRTPQEAREYVDDEIAASRRLDQ